jgi:hypothetical protein
MGFALLNPQPVLAPLFQPRVTERPAQFPQSKRLRKSINLVILADADYISK